MISICVPVWEFRGKGIEYLSELLDSMLKQSYQDFEVVISDHSEDFAIRDFVMEHQLKDRTTYVRCERLRGVAHSANCNMALDNASRDIIKIMFQDDYFFDNDALKIMLDEIKGDVKWVAAATWHIKDEDRSKLFGLAIPAISNTHEKPPFLRLGCPTNSMFVKNPARFDENLIWKMDIHFYQTMWHYLGNPNIITNPLFVTRRSKQQISEFVTKDQMNKEGAYFHHLAREKQKAEKEKLEKEKQS